MQEGLAAVLDDSGDHSSAKIAALSELWRVLSFPLLFHLHQCTDTLR